MKNMRDESMDCKLCENFSLIRRQSCIKILMVSLYKGKHVCMARWRTTRSSQIHIVDNWLKIVASHKRQHVALSLGVLYMSCSEVRLSSNRSSRTIIQFFFFFACWKIMGFCMRCLKNLGTKYSNGGM